MTHEKESVSGLRSNDKYEYVYRYEANNAEVISESLTRVEIDKEANVHQILLRKKVSLNLFSSRIIKIMKS